uniref:Peroxisomal membrane protein PEX14 n=1 Tax=Aceria tosichella TaxID=561515 RepID=A0A6G1S471_9ACAR
MDSQTRQEYVRAAVSFLQNPKLVDSTLKDKLKFLRDKGLSDLEVDEALNLALVPRSQSQSGKWNFLLILGVCIGGYKLYQAYLEQKSRKIESEQTTRQQDLIEPDRNQPTLNDILQKMSELKKLIELQRSNFGTEMQSLKTLLLGHEKFAAPPEIPKWQLPVAPTDPNPE